MQINRNKKPDEAFGWLCSPKGQNPWYNMCNPSTGSRLVPGPRHGSLIASQVPFPHAVPVFACCFTTVAGLPGSAVLQAQFIQHWLLSRLQGQGQMSAGLASSEGWEGAGAPGLASLHTCPLPVFPCPTLPFVQRHQSCQVRAHLNDLIST